MNWLVKSIIALAALALSFATAAQSLVTPPTAQVFDGGFIRAVATQPDGKVIIGGQFSNIGGVARSNIARLNADGTVDGSWNPGANDEVLAITIDGNGDVYAGGRFTSIGGQARNRLARLSPATGAADAVWNPDIECHPGLCPTWVVRALVLDRSGSIFVGGFFSNVGVAEFNNLARVSTSGAGAAVAGWIPDPCCGDVFALAMSGSGGIYVAGDYTIIGGQDRSYLTLVSLTIPPPDANGQPTPPAVDASWTPNPNGPVRTLLLDSGSLYAGGTFSSIGGQPFTSLGRLAAGGNGAADASWHPNANGNVLALVLDGAGNMYAAGDFSNIGGQGRKSIAKISLGGAGDADGAWNAGAPANAIVAAVGVASGGNAYAGGLFQTIGGQLRGGFATLNAATGIPEAGPLVLGSPGTVYALARDGSGRSVVGGAFLAVGSPSALTPRLNIARFNSDGTVDGGWNPGSNDTVLALVAETGGDVYAGGAFSAIGGQPRSFLAKLTGASGGADLAWNPGPNSVVYALALDGAGSLFAGGEFGVIARGNRSFVAKLSTADTGVLDESWNANANAAVRALGVDGTNLYAGGDFTGIGGQPRNFVARLLSTGAADTGWDPHPNGPVSALALDGASTAYIGGVFTDVGGFARNNLVKILSNGFIDGAWNPGPDGSVLAIAVAGGSVYPGGTFANVGGRARANLAKLASTGSGAAELTWDAKVNGAVRAVVAPNDGNVYFGGSFTKVVTQDRVAYAGLAPPNVNDTFPPNCQMPPGWSKPAAAATGWSVANDFVKSGSCSLKSNPASNSSAAEIQYNASFQAGTVSFARRVSSEQDFDCLRFYIDGVEKNIGGACSSQGGQGISGEVDWGTVSFPLAAGTHTLMWSYQKDFSLGFGSDAAWIDEVSLPPSVVGQPQTITFNQLPDHFYGEPPFGLTATASSGLPVSYSSLTLSVCTVSGSTVTILAGGACTIAADQPGNTTYAAAATVTVTFTVVQANQTISFAPLPDKPSNAPPFTISATASSGLPVTFTTSTPGICSVSGTTVTILGPGTCTINANQLGNANYNAAPQVSQSFSVGKSAQTITFGALPNRIFGDPPFGLSATASSGLAVTFDTTTPGVCSVSGSTVTILSTGSCRVTADQAGNASFNPAPQIAQTFTVFKGNQTIDFQPLPNRAASDPPFTVSATASSGLPVTFGSTTTAVCTVSGSTVTLVAAGTCTLVANQGGNATWNAAPTVAQSFPVTNNSQSITFDPLPDHVVGDPPFTVVATTSSGLTVIFSTTTTATCQVSGTTVTIVGGGTCTIDANQPGDANFGAAPQVSQSFNVVKLNQSISFGVLPNKITTDPASTLSATATSGLGVFFSTASAGVCSVSGATLTITGAGTCTVDANQPGNAAYNAAPTVSQPFTVSKASQTITFNALANKNFGDAPFAISASASSSLAVAFTTATPGTCSVSGTSVTVLAVGTCTINADQAGNATYNAAPQVAQSFSVNKANQTINFPALANKLFNDPPFTVSASATSSLAVSFSTTTTAVCTLAGTTVTIVAPGTCTISADQAGNTSYNAAPQVSRSFTVGKSGQAITFGALGAKAVNDPDFTVSATASSSLTVTFSSLTASICTMPAATTVHLVAQGTCTIAANQAGDANYNAAPQVTQSFQVGAPNTSPVTVTKAGTGSGTVTSTAGSPGAINCGSACSDNFANNSSVTLSASAAAGSQFTGWSGACSGTGSCVITIPVGGGAQAVTATFTQLTNTITVSKSGAGTGTVTSSPGPINCGATCAGTFNVASSVTLTATVPTGSVFGGWSGACAASGTNPTCTIASMPNSPQSVGAAFNIDTRVLTVTKTGTGSGTVTSSPAGISCGATCSGSFQVGGTVTLTAAPQAGSVFTSWSGGGCSGSSLTCNVVIASATTVTATFTIPTAQLAVNKTGAGSGTVTSTPAGINCGATCAATFNVGTSVTLTATVSSPGSTFTGWSGACSGSSATCTFTLNGAATATANFDVATAALTVTRSGAGSGTVTSTPAGINCGATCASSFSVGSSVLLTATPAAGSSFTGWSGVAGCAGTGPCSVTINNATSVTASFAIVQHVLTVTNAGPGTGTVTSAPSGINCGSTCSASFNEGSPVTLSANPGPGFTFQGWSGGGCSGTGQCVVPMSAATGVTATFGLGTFNLTVNRTGTGSGNVTSSPAGIDCGATCTAAFTTNSQVTLTAAAVSGSVFQGWSGAGCSGTGQCVVTMNATATVTANFVPQFTLTVAPAGAGSGTVTSSPAGINCGATCAFTFTSGATVTLTAAPASDSLFAGWSGGGCSGTGTCTVTINAALTVTATFVPSTFALTVNRAGGGSGTVTSAPAGISCGATCVFAFNSGASVTLTAAAASDSLFTGWSGGGCSGTGTCTVAMSAAQTVTATFAINTFPLTVNRTGGGSGTVTSSPAGINCGATCVASFNSGTLVTLTATPAAGSVFDGWSAGACVGTGTCQVSMSAAASVTAGFSISNPPRLINISTRGLVLTGDDVMIGGFIIEGAATKTVVVTGKGPSLTQYGIPNALSNPTLTLVRMSDNSVIAVNDDWVNGGNASQIQAAGFAPTHPLEAAVMMNLAPGAYTAVVSGVNNATGVGLVEVFEVDQPDVQLLNISTRGRVGTGDDVMIGGIIVQGNAPQEVVITAKGPSLAQYGISNPLPNPQLTLVRASDGQVIAVNDNWGSAANASQIQASGFAPSNAFEAAILITLPPGAYTAIVSGVNGTTGTAIIEVFAL